MKNLKTIVALILVGLTFVALAEGCRAKTKVAHGGRPAIRRIF
jgi:hypothetical protein